MSWKTYTGAGIIAGCAFAMYLGWIDEGQRQLILELGAALGLIGLGHKVDKLRKGK